MNNITNKSHSDYIAIAHNQFENYSNDHIGTNIELTEDDFDKLATLFEIYKRNDVLGKTSIGSNEDYIWSDTISKYLKDKTDKLENYKSNSGEYIVPVSWEVYSTVIVKGVSNLAEAIAKVRDNLDEIPLASEPEYIDASYKIDANTDEDFINAQGYKTKGVLMEIQKNEKPVMTRL